jgi:hypothetical protein
VAGGDLISDVLKQRAAGVRVGIHKNEPVAGGGAGAGIPGAADLVEGFEHDERARSAGDVAGAVGGIVVADDELEFPAARGEGGGGGFDLREGGAEELFLVEGGDDDGNLHGQKIACGGGFATGASFSSCILRRMIFNVGMSIWILAVLVIGATGLAGWRQGGIRAAIAFGGILFATLLCGLVGKIFHLVFPLFGTKDPLMVWALSPLFGFILVSIIFSVIAFNVHRQVDVHYRHKASDLRLALWERLNTRLGICVGVLNGAIYFVLISFLVFNLAYLTTQASAGVAQPSVMLRVVNSLGNDMQASGFTRTATAVGTLPPIYYQYADLAGFIVQNPQTAPRLVEYPALTSLWQRNDMQQLVTDSTLTNALASGASIGEIINEPSVQDFLKDKDLTKHVNELFSTNMADLTEYLKTGKSATYDGMKILGTWEFNPGVTVAWLRQSQPQIQASEMRGIRTLWSAAYAQTTLLITADSQVFVQNFPRFDPHPQHNQPAFTPENWNGDWSPDDASYTLHITMGGQDKFLTATTTDGLRLSVKDGRNLLIFDRAN